MSSVFRFKRFEVRNERSSMKVNTDGVLLGAAMELDASDHRLLDVGTGTGTIALMAAQRLHDLGAECVIDAIDIDQASAEEAAENFSASPWPDMLRASHISLDGFAAASGDGFDLIFSNPPYFDDSLKNPDARKSAARHSLSLSYRELIAFAADRLAPAGRLAMVLPSDCEQAMLRHARMFSLFPRRILRVRTVERKAPIRIIVELGREHSDCREELLTIHEKERYSEEYLSLTGDFYL